MADIRITPRGKKIVVQDVMGEHTIVGWASQIGDGITLQVQSEQARNVAKIRIPRDRLEEFKTFLAALEQDDLDTPLKQVGSDDR
jgi:hypothetical protein